MLIGTNAIVAVLAHTGYDLEDAMIINKSSFERGFGHGSVCKAEFVDLAEEGGRGSDRYFSGIDVSKQIFAALMTSNRNQVI